MAGDKVAFLPDKKIDHIHDIPEFTESPNCLTANQRIHFTLGYILDQIGLNGRWTHAFTVIPKGATSRANTRVNDSTAAFDAA